MNQDVKAKWVAALRSGEYGQATGQLREGDSHEFCCLGVLCDLSGLGTWVRGRYVIDQYRNSKFLPPKAVEEWAGWTAWNNFVSMNDNGAPFSQIADVIEADY